MAAICSWRYKYSATVRSLWLPGSCQRLLARLPHQSPSFLLPTDNTAIVAGLIFLRWGLNGLFCAQSASQTLTWRLFLYSEPWRWAYCNCHLATEKQNHNGRNLCHISSFEILQVSLFPHTLSTPSKLFLHKLCNSAIPKHATAHCDIWKSSAADLNI